MKLQLNILIFGISILISINQLHAIKFNKPANVIGVNGKNINVKNLFDDEDWNKLNKSLSLLPSPVDSLFRLMTNTIFHFYNAGSEIINNNTMPPKYAMDKTVVVRDLFISETPKISNKYLNERKSLPLDIQDVLNALDASYEEFIVTCILKSNDNACPLDSQRRFKQLMYNSTNSLENKLNQLIIAKFNQTIPNNGQTAAYPKNGFYHRILEEWKKNSKDCGTDNALQAKIYNLSLSIINSIGKYYAAMTLGYMVDFLNNLSNNQYFKFSRTVVEGKCLWKSIKIIEKFNEEVIIIMKNTQWIMSQTVSDIKRCDVGQQHKEGITFQRFRLFDAILLYNYANNFNSKKYTVYDDNLVFVDREKCLERTEVASMSLYWTPESNAEKRQPRHLVIEYFNNDLEIFGKENTTENQIWNFPDPPNFICSVEHTGDNFKNVVRDISLVPVEASPDYVVTGIRWRIKSRILFMEIQQGKLVNGSIVPDTVGWKMTPDNWTPADRVVLRTNLEISGTNGFVLDDVVLPPEYYLTAVQFDCNVDKAGENVQVDSLTKIKIQGTKYGIDSNDVIWKTMRTPSFGSSLDELVNEQDASEYAPNNRIVEMTEGGYVKIYPTNLKKDFAQNTIPYLDIQDVFLESAEPIRGIGMYYKGMEGYGGFVGLRALSNDISGLMDSSEIEKHFDGINCVFSGFQNPNMTQPMENSNEHNTDQHIVMQPPDNSFSTEKEITEEITTPIP